MKREPVHDRLVPDARSSRRGFLATSTATLGAAGLSRPLVLRGAPASSTVCLPRTSGVTVIRHLAVDEHRWARAGAANLAILLTMLAAPQRDARAASPPLPRGEQILQAFDFTGVTLDRGWLRTQVEETRKFYLGLNNDELLKGFRRRAGKPAPGKELLGWYGSDTFHVFGQIVSGLARLYAATGDPACRDKAKFLVTQWGNCLAPDGYFYYSRRPNAPHYTYDKMMWGLLDAYHYCGSGEALQYAGRITDWAIKNLPRIRQLGHTATEWYTLSENLYRAYLLTGDPKYRDFAREWEYTEYWDIYARDADLFARRPDGRQTPSCHAYSHVNTLGGAGAAYLVTGQPRYLDILKNAYDYLQSHETFATGGYGPDEQLLPRDELIRHLYYTSATFETQCGSWAAFKMARYLMTFTSCWSRCRETLRPAGWTRCAPLRPRFPAVRWCWLSRLPTAPSCGKSTWPTRAVR